MPVLLIGSWVCCSPGKYEWDGLVCSVIFTEIHTNRTSSFTRSCSFIAKKHPLLCPKIKWIDSWGEGVFSSHVLIFRVNLIRICLFVCMCVCWWGHVLATVCMWRSQDTLDVSSWFPSCLGQNFFAAWHFLWHSTRPVHVWEYSPVFMWHLVVGTLRLQTL